MCKLCARVAYNALKGRNHAKATSFVFQLGREVIEAHGWQDREPPKVIKQKLIEKEGRYKLGTEEKLLTIPSEYNGVQITNDIKKHFKKVILEQELRNEMTKRANMNNEFPEGVDFINTD